MMRRLSKIIDNLAQHIAVIDIGKQISEHLASKKDANTKKKRNRLISQRLRFLQVIPTGSILLQHITKTYAIPLYFSGIYNIVEM